MPTNNHETQKNIADVFGQVVARELMLAMANYILNDKNRMGRMVGTWFLVSWSSLARSYIESWSV